MHSSILLEEGPPHLQVGELVGKVPMDMIPNCVDGVPNGPVLHPEDVLHAKQLQLRCAEPATSQYKAKLSVSPVEKEQQGELPIHPTILLGAY